jgi:uncharacterized protein YoaH (UPF0181 family)
MTSIELILEEHRRAIAAIERRNELIAEALASHASVIRMMAQQIRDMSSEMDVDITPPRMM